MFRGRRFVIDTCARIARGAPRKREAHPATQQA
jgi:hypothetical protein